MGDDRRDDQFSRNDATTCGSLLMELQRIWDEVGEGEAERDKMLLEIEQACLEVYRRKVDDADNFRSNLRREISVAEAEIARICTALGEKPLNCEKKNGVSLREEMQCIRPVLEEMRERRKERKRKFVKVLDELRDISEEIYGSTEDDLYKVVMEGTDLSMLKLEELITRLNELRNEKSERLKQVLDHINNVNSLCMVLGMDFKHTINKINPTLNDSNGKKDITDTTIKRLLTAVQSLMEVKIRRMQRLQNLATTLVEFWDLMDTPLEEQQMFENVTSKIVASEPEITEPNMLSMDFIQSVENEVSRLEQLKSSKVKEIILKKSLELEEICRSTHLFSETGAKYSTQAVISGDVDLVYLLEEIELEIAKVKEEALSRKEILDKVDKWLAVCEEESWLAEYNRDENRYNAGRGTHLALKRAEKARVLVNKIPAMVEAVTLKTVAWEKEKGTEFLYDGERLLTRLEEYSYLRKQKEEERLKQRDQKRLQVQLIAEQEALFGSKPSPCASVKRASRTSTGVPSDRKLSLGGAMLQNHKAERASPRVHANKKGDSLIQNSYQQYGNYASQSSGRRDSEIPGRLLKKQPTTAAKACETDSRKIRKPLSPLSLTLSSKANIPNFIEEQTRKQNGTLHSMDPCNKQKTETPRKAICTGDEENRTPRKLSMSVPKTPSTVSAPMLMASTPASPYIPYGAKAVRNIGECTEYSFEELRAGFLYPTIQS